MPCFDPLETASKKETLEKEILVIQATLYRVLIEARYSELVDWKRADIAFAEFQRLGKEYQQLNTEIVEHKVIAVAGVIESELNTLRSVVLHPKGESVFNGFKYSDEMLLDAASVFNSLLNKNKGLGELNPKERDTNDDINEYYRSEFMPVNKEVAAIKVTNIYFNPDLGVVGDVLILDTPAGNLFKTIVESNDKYIFRMCAMVEFNPRYPDLAKKCRIISFDVLSPPPESLDVILQRPL